MRYEYDWCARHPSGDTHCPDCIDAVTSNRRRVVAVFTPEQEARIREIMREEAIRANHAAGKRADEPWSPR